jgi:hypothetical protein
MNTFREWLTIALACLGIGTGIKVILSDIWFQQGVVGRFVAALILAVVVGAVWVGGVIHGMGQCDENPELLENSDD